MRGDERRRFAVVGAGRARSPPRAALVRSDVLVVDVGVDGAQQDARRRQHVDGDEARTAQHGGRRGARVGRRGGERQAA